MTPLWIFSLEYLTLQYQTLESTSTQSATAEENQPTEHSGFTPTFMDSHYPALRHRKSAPKYPAQLTSHDPSQE